MIKSQNHIPTYSERPTELWKEPLLKGTFFRMPTLGLTEIWSETFNRMEVVCAKLAVEPGAEFSATCIMKTNTKVPAHDEQPKPEQAEQQ